MGNHAGKRQRHVLHICLQGQRSVVARKRQRGTVYGQIADMFPADAGS